MDGLKNILDGDKSKIDVCTIKESDIAKNWGANKEKMEESVQGYIILRSILATRLSSDGNWNGMVDFFEAFRPDTSDYGIQRRLVSFK